LETISITKTQYKVSDFLSWQRDGSLELSPSFQRRSVWKPNAKSFFVDTVVRGLPAPLIYVRERIDLDTQRNVREVVDGQQRLRTLFAFVDKALLPDFDPKRDDFTVLPIHNKEVAGKPYAKLSDLDKSEILDYEFSTHVLPSSVEDRDVLRIFARLNATGVKLNRQELRNAEYHGVLKTLMYELAYEQLERWRNWNIFSEDQISRMTEVELTSDLTLNMLLGLTGKTQDRLDNLYMNNEQSFDGAKEVSTRFRHVMDTIDNILGNKITKTVFSREVNFFTLFVYLYDRMYGLGSSLERKRASKISSGVSRCLLKVSENLRNGDVPAEVLDAIGRASADLGRRRTRLQYFHEMCDDEAT
jgi:hypothetical protein